MRILFIQPVPPLDWDERTDYADDVARLAARLRDLGHESSLLLVSAYDEEALRLKIADVRPDHVIIYLESFFVDIARRLAEQISSRYYLPIIIGGPHATVDPLKTLSLIGVEGVVLGEWDRAVPAYLDARRRGADYVQTEGFWFQTESGIIRNPIAPPETPDQMVPVPDRRLYPADRVVGADGLVTVLPARGCHFYCAHCQMDLAAGLYEERSMTFLRRRPVGHLVLEAQHLCQTYPTLRGLRFAGCSFSLDESHLRRFAEAFSADVRLPLVVRVKPDALTDTHAQLLRRAGCVEVELEVLSGSDFIRNEIFNLDVTDAQIAAAFATVRKAGMRSRALVQVGLPYDTLVTMEATGNLLRRVGADSVGVGIYYPLPGTKAHALCRENGWLSGRDAAAYFNGISPLDLPGLAPDTIRRYAALVPRLAVAPKKGRLLEQLDRVRLGRRSMADIIAPLLRPRRGGHPS